jgi:hypothetical protein
MSTEGDEKERGFTVVDRRGGADTSEDAPAETGAAAPEEALPAVDFASFALSLGTSALYHLGMVGDPERGETAPEPNLPLARQTIDIIEMIQQKTRGNLDEEETRLLDSLLYELRMRFVEAGKSGS